MKEASVVCLLLLLVCVCYNEVHASENIEQLLRIQQFYPVPNAVCPWKYTKLRAVALSLNSLGEMIVSTNEGFIKKISAGLVNVTTIVGSGSDASSVSINDLSMASVNGMRKIINHPNNTSIMYGLYTNTLVKMDLKSNSMKVYTDVGNDLSDGVFGGDDGMLYYTAGTCVRKFDTKTETSSVYAGDCSSTGNGVSGNPYSTEKLGTIKGIVYYNFHFYIADAYFHCIRKLSTSDQLLVNYAGDCSRNSSPDIPGIGTNARFSKVSTTNALSSMTLFKDTLYISGDSTVRKVNLTTGEVSSTYFKAQSVIVDLIVKKDNEVYYLVDNDKTIYRMNDQGTQSAVLLIIMTKDPFPIDCLSCSSFTAIDVFRNGDLVFVCSPLEVILKLSFKDRIITPLAININYVRGIYYLKINPFNEDELYFLTDRTLTKYTISTSGYKVITPQTRESLSPNGMPLKGATFRNNAYMYINPYTNELYMIENDDNRVTKIKGEKQIPFISIKNPQSMVFKPDGTAYVFSVKDHFIYYVDSNAAQTIFSYAGNLQKMAWYDGSLYCLTTTGGSVAKVDKNGAFTTLKTSKYPCASASNDFLFNGTYIYILCANSLVRHPIVGGTVETLDDSLPPSSSFTLVNDEFIIASKDYHYLIKKRIGANYEPYIGQPGLSSGPIEGSIQDVRLYSPYSVVSDNNGDLYVMLGTAVDDYRNIIKVSNGVSTYFAGQGDGLSVETTIFGSIHSFDFLRNGEIVVESTSLRVIQSDGTVKTILGHNGYASSDSMISNSVASPFSTVIPSFFTMTVDRSTGALYFSTALAQIQEMYNNTYRRVIGPGLPGYSGDGAQAEALIDNDSSFIYFDGSRKALIFCDTKNNVVRMVNSDGIASTIIGSGQLGFGFIKDGISPLTLNISKPKFVVSNGDDMFIAEGTSSGTPRLFRVMGCDKNGWTGEHCNIPTCFGLANYSSGVCMGNGVCSSSDNCTCYTGFFGLQCNDFKCNNIPHSNSSVCSGHGKCTTVETCVCNRDGNIIYYGNNCENKKCYGNYAGDECDQLSCFNVLSGNSSVCSGHGTCTNTDTCLCKRDGNIIYYGDNCELKKCYGNYTGDACDQFSCFNLLSHNPSVCSGRGSCNGTDYCICKTGYSGDCSHFTCGNISSSDATACSGKGKCVDYNTCNCDLYYYGNQCQNFNESAITCDGISFVSNRTCSGHGNCTAKDTCKCQNEGNLIHYGSNCELNKCADNYYGSYCSAFCKQDLNCSAHGVCNNEGLCTCNYDETNGFYVGPSCSECEADYYGDKCLTKFQPSMTLLSNNGLEIYMKLYAPISYNANSIDCSNAIHPLNISLLGSSAECLWSDKTNGNFTIRLGVSKSVEIDSVIKVNVNAFSTLPTPSPQYIDTTINGPINPIVPVAIISNVDGALLGICDEISIDGSKSFNIDKNELLYEWSLLDCPLTALQMVPSKTSNWLFASSIPSGSYSVQLIVKSKYLNWKSSPVVYNFTKYDILLPQIGISTNTLISNKNLPLLIKKYEIWENTCGANIPDKSLFTYSWVQLEGGSTNFTQQSTNDMLLLSVKDYSYQKYVFQVTLYYKQFKSSNQITIFKTQDTFNLVLYQSVVDYTSVVVNVQIDPLVSSNYANSLPWVWTCKLQDGSNCEASLLNQLDQHSSSRSTTFKLATTVQVPVINLKLQVNTIESTLSVKFSTDVVVVDVLSVYPVKSFYNLEDVLSASFLVSVNGKSDGINSLIQRSWTLNDKSISASSLSNNLDLPLSSLSQGSTNTLTLIVTSIQSKDSSSNSVIFKMATPPPPCKCTISPSSGYALETTFSISCPNCITSDQTLQVGFVDYGSGIKVPLTNAASLSVPLPYTGSTTLSLYATVTNVNTLAAVSSTFKAQVLVPSAISVTEVKKKKSGWDTTYKSLAVGNPKKIVFGYITTVVSAMYDVILATGARRSICPPGYTKKDCSMTMADWQDVTSEKVNTTKMIFDSFTRDSLGEQVNGEILAMQTLAIYRAVERVDEVNGELFDLCWNTYKNQLQEALLEQNMELSLQLMNFLSLTLSNLKQSREFIDGNRTSTTFKSELTTVANDLTSLNSRNIRVGSSCTANVGSYELTVTKLYPSDLSERMFTISNALEGVIYPNMSTQYIQNVDLRKVIYQKVVQKYLNNEDIYNFKYSTGDINVTITGIPYVLSTEITNQEMIIPQTSRVLSYVFHYIKPTESYDNSSVVFTSEILCISDSSCAMNDLGNDQYSCVCGPSTNVTIAEKRTLRVIPKPTPVEKSSQVVPIISNDLGYLGFIALGVVVLILVVIIVIVVFVILRMKKKPNPTSLPSMSSKGIEMQNV